MECSGVSDDGIDPSLFHDDDGRKYLLNQFLDFRTHKPKFSGIVLQRYSETEQKLTGPSRKIFEGTELGITEGPHLYRREGWYYLMTAEGGTGHRHSVTMARSRRIESPYEVDPENPLLTAADKPDPVLQGMPRSLRRRTESGPWCTCAEGR